MRLSLLFIAVFLFTHNEAYAENTDAEQEIYAQFETVCLSFLNDYKRAIPVLDTLGHQLDEKNANKFLYPQTGNAWMIKGKFSKSVVTLSDSGACSVSSPRNVFGNLVKDIFVKETGAKMVDSEKVGSHNHDVFKVNFPDAFGDENADGVVSITTNTLEPFKDSVILNAILESTVKDER